MNQDNPYAMNQTCKVCGEPAAGFHFGAFTCEGCKSFFGRSYNNITSIADCKNNGECIINKKNRTACKACRLRKCLMVGMSKSGSRYGRRSNWFKIHCLMQEQQQQAAAAMAAAAAAQQQHNSHHHLRQHAAGPQPTSHLHHGQHQHQHQQQQHHQNAHAAAVHHQQAVAAAAAAHMQGLAAAAAAVAASSGQKAAACDSGPTAATPLSTAPTAPPNLSMLYHTGPRSKEELLMLGLDEYAKHPRISPSVGSPDSHHSDSSSVEVSVTRGSSASNHSLLLSQRRAGSSTGTPPPMSGGAAPLPPPQPLQLGRKELSSSASASASAAFLPLHFPGLGSMPVMPPPPFLPPSHLLLPGYHPALYSHHHHAHHHGLLKPSAEQQQQAVAAAAAVQHLFNSAARFTPVANVDCNEHLGESISTTSPHKANTNAQTITTTTNNNNNNHIPNGSNAAEELTKRFYLDAVLKSQCYGGGGGGVGSPPPTTTKLPAHPKYDHSISALVTPNSESGRDRLRSRQSNEGEEDDDNDDDEDNENARRVNAVDAAADDAKLQPPLNEGSECDEDLVVSMTPPRSPPIRIHGAPTRLLLGQDNPIDLSMKTTGSSSVSSSLSSAGSGVGADDDPPPTALADEEPNDTGDYRSRLDSCNSNNNNNNNSNENNNNDALTHDEGEKLPLPDRQASPVQCDVSGTEKRKAICCEPDDDAEADKVDALEVDAGDQQPLAGVKRLKLQTQEDSLPPLDLSKI